MRKNNEKRQIMTILSVSRLCAIVFIVFPFCIQGQGNERLVLSISQQEVTLEETFRMVVSASRVGEQDDLDVSLLNENFEIVDINFDKYSYLMNRQLSNSSTWIITLRPKRTGELTIPSVRLGQAISSEDYIDVVDVDEELAKKDPPLRIETRLSSSNAFIGQDVLYTILVYQEPDVVRRRIYQSFPAEISATQLGEDELIIEYEVGKPVKFSRRYYLLNALIEGVYEIPAPAFTGVARTRNQGNFGRIFSTEEEVSVMGNSTQIQMTSRSGQDREKSLLASEITLAASWQSPSFKVGVPNLLSVNVSAVGISAERLPNIVINLPESLRGYPEGTTRELSVKDNNLIANLSSTIAIIPTVPGDLSIEDITLDWYNVESKQPESTTFSFDILSVQESQTGPRSTQLVTSWYTDYRLYMLLCLILFVTYVVHVRRLKAQLTKEEHEHTELESTKILSLNKVIDAINDAELPRALKVYLDEKLSKQPSLTHHQKSATLQSISPELCLLIERYFDTCYGNGRYNPESTGLQPLSIDFYASLRASLNTLEESVRKNPPIKVRITERYIY